MYDAIDTDNEGTIECMQVEEFGINLLKGSQKEGEINTDCSMDHEETFRILKENESGEVTFDELGVLLKNQIRILQKRYQRQEYERSLEVVMVME